MIIAHDLGTTGDKASLHEDDGRLITAVTVGYWTRYATGGVAEQDPHDWWAAACRATGELLERAGRRADEVDAVGLSGQMMGRSSSTSIWHRCGRRSSGPTTGPLRRLSGSAGPSRVRSRLG